MGVTGERQSTARRGREGTVPFAVYAAAPGTTSPGSCAPRSASGAPLGTGTTVSGSVWPGPLPLESSDLYLIWGSRGDAPWLGLGKSPTPHSGSLDGLEKEI